MDIYNLKVWEKKKSGMGTLSESCAIIKQIMMATDGKVKTEQLFFLLREILTLC